MTRAKPRPDPTGDERADMLVRLEYGLNPIDDERYEATYLSAAEREVRRAARYDDPGRDTAAT